MPGKKSQKKKKPPKSKISHIAAALTPTAAFAAVPRTPPVKTEKDFVSGLPTQLLNTTMLNRLFSESVAAADVDNDDTSLDDYNDPMYDIVRHRVGSPVNTSTQSDLDEGLRDYAEYDPNYSNLNMNAGHSGRNSVQDSSTLPAYHNQEDIIESDEVDGGLYATPKRRVHHVDVHDAIPKEIEREEIQAVNVKVQESVSPSRSHGGIQMTSPSLDLYPTRDTNAEPGASVSSVTPRTPRINQLKKQNEQLEQRQLRIEEELLRQKEMHESIRIRLDESHRASGNLRDSDFLEEHTTLTETMHSQDELIKTLQDRINTLENEKIEHQEENTQLLKDMESFRRYVNEKEGISGGSETMLHHKQIQDLKDECDVLKNTVQRINIELSRSQASKRPLSQQDLKNIAGLPSKGPVPSWLINVKYLAPLFLAYDDRLNEKDDIIKQYESEINQFRHGVEEIIRENERLHIRLEQTDQTGPISMTEWQQLQEQAKLVLEENQLLLQQLDVQQEKAKQMHSMHVQEVNRIKRDQAQASAEKEDFRSELTEVRQRYNVIKNKHETLVIELESKMTKNEERLVMEDLKRTLEEMQSQHTREFTDLVAKFQTAQFENKNLATQSADLVAENKQLQIEVRGLQKSYKKAQKRNLLLQKALELSEDKELSSQDYLNSVVKMAEKTAAERDTYVQLIREQEQEKQTTTMFGDRSVGKMEEKLKQYKAKATEKVMAASHRLKEQEDHFERQRIEYEREIRHLRMLMKEKDGMINVAEGEKRKVEEDLEVMWQAASADNRRMKETIDRTFRKLKDHKELEHMFEDDTKELLGLSEGS